MNSRNSSLCSYQVAPKREQLGMTAMRKQCPQVFENTGFARVCKKFSRYPLACKWIHEASTLTFPAFCPFKSLFIW
ncbi:MAG: hypothetical protein FWG02_10945, partial [Holophagaceae bacterium]|nr:hypothetical protein [Holophagaceae bacterium]